MFCGKLTFIRKWWCFSTKLIFSAYRQGYFVSWIFLEHFFNRQFYRKSTFLEESSRFATERVSSFVNLRSVLFLDVPRKFFYATELDPNDMWLRKLSMRAHWRCFLKIPFWGMIFKTARFFLVWVGPFRFLNVPKISFSQVELSPKLHFWIAQIWFCMLLFCETAKLNL